MDNKIYTLIGKRGAGKTPFIVGGDWEVGMAELWLRKGMSTLVIDELDHHKYQEFKILHPKDYRKLSTHPGKYRTLAPRQHLQKLVQKIGNEKLAWNCNIVMEDSKKYIPAKFTQDEWCLVGNSKQQNADLTTMWWNWGIASLDVIRNTNYFVIFPTSDGPKCREEYLGGCYEKCLEAHRLVCSNPKKYPYLIVDSGI